MILCFCKYHATYDHQIKKKNMKDFFRTGYEGSYAIVIRNGVDWFPSQSWASVKAYETTKRMCDAVLYNVHFVHCEVCVKRRAWAVGWKLTLSGRLNFEIGQQVSYVMSHSGRVVQDVNGLLLS